MNDIHQSILSTKMLTMRQRLPFREVPSFHMIKLERGLIQRSLLYCFEKGYFSLIRYLLQSGSADARERDNEGRNGLMYCCFIDNDCWAQNIAMVLLEYGAKVEDQDQRKLNALHYAIVTQRSILVRRYLASLDFDLSRTTDIYGNTCLHYACSTGNADITRSILDAMKRYSIDLNIKNRHESTAYDIACALKHERCQNLLRNEITLHERNNQIPTNKNVSHIALKSLFERRSSIPIRVRSITTTTQHTESIASVPIYALSSKIFRNHCPTTLNCNSENVVHSSTIFVDPIESRRITLKRNESLDLSLSNQAKHRADFVASPFISQSTIFSSSSSTWRDDFSKMFNELQTFKTPSYRKTIHPPLSTELPSELFDNSSEMGGTDVYDGSHHQSSSPFRTGLSQKVIHRRQSSASSGSVQHKTKK
ncbi:unnamed protein product [Rotaria sp. Silwood2]|nr:unnamed protein product [Rotaria sp. Silwood2]CAF2648923.1 unnamed protein product [Rotaria sp. Silwood2]CAF2918513.1 unnamed protein product [Rotaria sp. Silwood2]CAF3061374.1 unnamed protein product [Rotaria sp. Silwood2]CAF4208907.1 unnamed protein product [Rotaria sp. Silwood2]